MNLFPPSSRTRGGPCENTCRSFDGRRKGTMEAYSTGCCYYLTYPTCSASSRTLLRTKRVGESFHVMACEWLARRPPLHGASFPVAAFPGCADGSSSFHGRSQKSRRFSKHREVRRQEGGGIEHRLLACRCSVPSWSAQGAGLSLAAPAES